jgi:hypothetical protein
MRLIGVGLMPIIALTVARGGGGTSSATPTTASQADRECSSADLMGAFEAVHPLVGPDLQARVLLANTSATDCLLSERPSLRLLGPGQVAIPAGITDACDTGEGGCAEQAPVVLGAATEISASDLSDGASTWLFWRQPYVSSQCDDPVARVEYLDLTIAHARVIVPLEPTIDYIRVCGTQLAVAPLEPLSVVLDKFPKPPGPQTVGPTPIATLDPAFVRSCGATEVNVTWFNEQPYNSSSSSVAFVVSNQSDTPCTVSGSPDVVLEEGGIPSNVRRVRSSVCFPGLSCPEYHGVILTPVPTTLSASSTPISEAPQTAYFEMTWANHDGAGFCDKPKPRLTLREVVLSNIGAFTPTQSPDAANQSQSDVPVFTSCGTTVYLGSLWPRDLFHSGFPTYPVDVTVDMPLMAEGQSYDFTIKLTNKTAFPLTFDDPCPIATLEIGRGTVGVPDFEFRERREDPLDCGSQRVIEPGQSADFPYTISVPSDLPGEPWEWGLIWYMGDGSDPKSGVLTSRGLQRVTR